MQLLGILSRLKKETKRQIAASVARILSNPEESMERVTASLLANKDFKRGYTVLGLIFASELMRPSTVVFMSICESRLIQHDPDRGESYRKRPYKEILEQLKKSVEELESVPEGGKIVTICADIANYAQFLALSRGELDEFLPEL